MYSFSSFQIVSLNHTNSPIPISLLRSLVKQSTSIMHTFKVGREPLLVLRSCICNPETWSPWFRPPVQNKIHKSQDYLSSPFQGSFSIPSTIPCDIWTPHIFQFSKCTLVGSLPYFTCVLTWAIHTNTSNQQRFGGTSVYEHIIG